MIIFKTKILLLLFFLPVIFFTPTCKNKPTPPETTEIKPIEPEMILIDEDLTFTYMESVQKPVIDTSFVMTLEPYYIGKYEVMNQEFLQFILDDGYNNPDYWTEEGWEEKEEKGWIRPLFWGDGIKYWSADSSSNLPDTPVRAISFYEAEAYCNWLSLKTEKNYALPTSAQWIRAARGPDPGRMYPWGDEWIVGNANYSFINYLGILLQVNSLPEGKSYDGCYHLIGNVFEYVIPFLIKKHNGKVMIFSSYHFFLFSENNQYTTYTYDHLSPNLRDWTCGFRICKN